MEAVWPSGCSTRLVIWPHVSKPSTLFLTGFILISVALSSAPCLCFVYNQLVCLRQVWISNHFTPKSDNLLTFLIISALNLKLRLHVYSGKDFPLKKSSWLLKYSPCQNLKRGLEYHYQRSQVYLGNDSQLKKLLIVKKILFISTLRELWSITPESEIKVTSIFRKLFSTKKALDG